MYIINSVGIAYHQCEALYIIKPQVDARWRVMRYSPEGADDMHDCVVMIYQACGLDKKILVPKNEDFLCCVSDLDAKTLVADLDARRFCRGDNNPLAMMGVALNRYLLGRNAMLVNEVYVIRYF